MKNLKNILALLAPWKWHFLLSAFLLIVGIFIRMLEPLIFLVAVDYVIPIAKGAQPSLVGIDNVVLKAIVSGLELIKTQSAGALFLGLGLIYLIISVLRAGFVFLGKAINASATESSAKALRTRFFSHIQNLPMAYFPEISTGELIQRSTGDIETIRRFVGNQTVEVLRLTAIFIFSSYWLFSGNFWFGIVSISTVPLIAISSYIFFKKEQKVWQEHEDEADKLNGIVQENIAGIRVVKAFAQEEEEIEKFEKQNLKKLRVALKHAVLHTVFWPISDFMVHFQIILAIFFGGYLVLNGAITDGQLISFYTYILMVAWPMRQVGRLLSEMGMALVAMERIKKILDQEEEQELEGSIKMSEISKIEFKDLWFKYGPKEDYVLKGINLVIEPGTSVAILGPTGSGKSTLSKLLLRFYEPSKGDILINDVSISKIPKKYLRRRIGLMLQQAFLFTKSVEGNIQYATDEVLDERMEEVASLSGLEEIRSVFSDGFKTLVGEKGVTLSGGQRQRVSIARTLLQEPDLLVMDDVTSAVDSITEANILQGLNGEMKNKTTIVITHRLTAIPYMDKIVILEDGVVSDAGTHKELASKNEFYKQIHEIQNVVEEEIGLVKRGNDD